MNLLLLAAAFGSLQVGDPAAMTEDGVRAFEACAIQQEADPLCAPSPEDLETFVACAEQRLQTPAVSGGRFGSAIVF